MLETEGVTPYWLYKETLTAFRVCPLPQSSMAEATTSVENLIKGREFAQMNVCPHSRQRTLLPPLEYP